MVSAWHLCLYKLKLVQQILLNYLIFEKKIILTVGTVLLLIQLITYTQHRLSWSTQSCRSPSCCHISAEKTFTHFAWIFTCQRLLRMDGEKTVLGLYTILWQQISKCYWYIAWSHSQWVHTCTSLLFADKVTRTYDETMNQKYIVILKLPNILGKKHTAPLAPHYKHIPLPWISTYSSYISRCSKFDSSGFSPTVTKGR